MSGQASIFVEDARIIEHTAYAGDQYVLHLEVDKIARTARPGSFVHVRCHEQLPMRRPLSIMRADSNRGSIDLLYRVVGQGTSLLSGQSVGSTISLIGPVGVPFHIEEEWTLPLLIGGGVGIPPMVFLAEQMKSHGSTYSPLVLMGSETPFPFRSRPSQIMVPGMPDGVIAAMPLFEDWGIPSRLASLQDFPGCHQGYVTELARLWLDGLDPAFLERVCLFACGPEPMLSAVAELARAYRLPCQISLEEHMACAVGGCAGCTVPIYSEAGVAMKRVCVDGPVFDSRAVYPDPE